MRFHSSTFIITLTRLAVFMLMCLLLAPAQADRDGLSPRALKPDIITALANKGIYTAPALRYGSDEKTIAAMLRKARTTTRVLLLDQLPPQTTSSRQLAAAVHERLQLGDGLVIVVTERPRSVVAYGAGLDEQTVQNIVNAPRKTFDAEGYAAGISQIVRLVDQERANRSAARIQIVLLIVGMALVLSIFWLRRRSRAASSSAPAHSVG